MATYSPKFIPGQRWTATTSADVTGGQLLAVSGSGTVGPAAAASIAVVGVAAFDAKNGEVVTVHSPSIGWLTSSGAIAAGAQVVPAASGAVSALAAVTTPTPADVTNTRTIVGVALTTAANNKVLVKFQ